MVAQFGIGVLAMLCLLLGFVKLGYRNLGKDTMKSQVEALHTDTTFKSFALVLEEMVLTETADRMLLLQGVAEAGTGSYTDTVPGTTQLHVAALLRAFTLELTLPNLQKAAAPTSQPGLLLTAAASCAPSSDLDLLLPAFLPLTTHPLPPHFCFAFYFVFIVIDKIILQPH